MSDRSNLKLLANRKALGRHLKNGEVVYLGYHAIAKGTIKQTKTGTWVILEDPFAGKKKYKFEDREFTSERITDIKPIVEAKLDKISDLRLRKIKKALNAPEWEVKPNLEVINKLKKENLSQGDHVKYIKGMLPSVKILKQQLIDYLQQCIDTNDLCHLDWYSDYILVEEK